MTPMERAAVSTGYAEYFDAAGAQLRDIDVTGDYYNTNHGETFPKWVQQRLDAGQLNMRIREPR